MILLETGYSLRVGFDVYTHLLCSIELKISSNYRVLKLDFFNLFTSTIFSIEKT